MSQSKIAPGMQGGLRKLQVGCGPKSIFSDWWNVDIRAFEGIDQTLDVTNDWGYSECLDYVYGEHFLEHLSLSNAIMFLGHAFTALLKGGKIRLSTPSLEWVVATHYQPSNSHSTDKEIQQTLAINRAFYGWGHQFLYSRTLLESLLKATGFSRISFFEYGKSDDQNLQNLERHGGYSIRAGYPSVWIVEASKLGDEYHVDEVFKNELQTNFIRYVNSGH